MCTMIMESIYHKRSYIYKKATYHVKNSYLWISTLLVVHSINSDLGTILPKILKHYTTKFEWTTLFVRYQYFSGSTICIN